MPIVEHDHADTLGLAVPPDGELGPLNAVGRLVQNVPKHRELTGRASSEKRQREVQVRTRDDSHPLAAGVRVARPPSELVGGAGRERKAVEEAQVVTTLNRSFRLSRRGVARP